MFEGKAATFLYCVSPVHMGAGTAIGAIDNPIQRERHTDHPMMAGSGIKGALRHHWTAQLADNGRQQSGSLVNRLFGPSEDAADHASAVSFADAQVVLFPVRSHRRCFVYATCPTALARLQRLLGFAGMKDDDVSWSIPALDDHECACSAGLATRDGLILEAYQFARTEDDVSQIAEWLANYALPPGTGFDYFRSKLKSDLVVLADERFNFFVRHATVVEPHVRINDESGTADDGGLFYTENLPAESLLVSLAMTTRERFGNKKRTAGDGEQKPAAPLSAADVLRRLREGDTQEGLRGFDGELVQIGGDATTGRGQVVLRWLAAS